jgi:hypothetical protein
MKNLQSGGSGSSSGSYHGPDDELGHLLPKMGAWKGSGDRLSHPKILNFGMWLKFIKFKNFLSIE